MSRRLCLHLLLLQGKSPLEPQKVLLLKRQQEVHVDHSWLLMEMIRWNRTVSTWRRWSFLPVFPVHACPPTCCLFFFFVRLFECLNTSSALFLDVLEKTVEGEAAALTQAKTLYKSCTNERKSAGLAQPWPSVLFFF